MASNEGSLTPTSVSKNEIGILIEVVSRKYEDAEVIEISMDGNPLLHLTQDAALSLMRKIAKASHLELSEWAASKWTNTPPEVRPYSNNEPLHITTSSDTSVEWVGGSNLSDVSTSYSIPWGGSVSSTPVLRSYVVVINTRSICIPAPPSCNVYPVFSIGSRGILLERILDLNNGWYSSTNQSEYGSILNAPLWELRVTVSADSPNIPIHPDQWGTPEVLPG
jgi:hypothetical protein